VIKLTERQVRIGIKGLITELRSDIRAGDLDRDTSRETLIEWMDEKADQLWGELVQQGRIDQYDAGELIETAPACGAILSLAQENGCLETGSGLWEGLTFGVLASMAYFSLRNLLYHFLCDAGVDSNNEQPLRKGVKR
jgi:hypothetical protein